MNFLNLTNRVIIGMVALLLLAPLPNIKHSLPLGIQGVAFNPDYPLTVNYHGVSGRGIEYDTNENGYRSEPIRPDRKHFLFLGDSTAFGLNIQANETISARVEQELNSRVETFQCINAAAPGHGARAELKVLKKVISNPKMNLQGVVLCFFGNDFVDDYLHAKYQEPAVSQSVGLKQRAKELWRNAKQVRNKVSTFVWQSTVITSTSLYRLDSFQEELTIKLPTLKPVEDRTISQNFVYEASLGVKYNGMVCHMTN